MRSLLFLLFIAYANCFYVNHDQPKKDKIVGGDSIGIEKVPYQANLIFSDHPICGATIIDASWILTAAHCVEFETTSTILIRTGTAQTLIGGEKHNASKFIIHPQYNTKNLDNDIALIKLAEPLVFNEFQKAIPIAKPDDIPQEGQNMLITGFGKTTDRGYNPRLLQAALVPVSVQATCTKLYEVIRDPITKNMFCAGNGNTDACQGDSGGPGVIEGKLYGIISSGRGCGSHTFPGVYTRVHLYHDWIEENTGLKF